jgi:hypothetical protein
MLCSVSLWTPQCLRSHVTYSSQTTRGVNWVKNSHFSGFAPRANLSHVNFLNDGTLQVVMTKRKKSA